jgi:MerR HTH family regulatory protein
MTDSPALRAAAILDDQVTDGAAQFASDLAEGILPTTSDRPPLVRFYMTSDLRAATGLPRTHLDYYLREGLILPTARTESGYLLFDDNELETLRLIIAQRQSGVAIREIRRRLGR